MSPKSTQIYLTEEEHAALQRAADRTGSSMTAVIRSLIDRYLISEEEPPTDLSELVGAIATAQPTDVAAERHTLLYEDLLADLHGH